MLVKEDPRDLMPRYRPSIWSQYRPVDITMYDLMFDDDWRKWEFWRKGQHTSFNVCENGHRGAYVVKFNDHKAFFKISTDLPN